MVAPPASTTTRVDRIVSLDALRGFNFVWILGGEGVVLALADILDDRNDTLDTVAAVLRRQITHAQWEGFYFYDFVFPLFIFITGVATALSVPRLIERRGLLRAHLRILARSVVLYVLGVAYYGGISPHWSEIRYLGVLQRIAICYFVAATLTMHMRWRGIVAITAALLIGYWALMTFVPVPGIGAGSFGPDANLANWIDLHHLPGRLWDGTRDPEGLLSTLPAIASCLLGVLAGQLLMNPVVRQERKVVFLAAAGAVLVIAGHAWAVQFPIVKAIWTSSFVLVAAGYSAILLAAFYLLIDVWGYRRWATVFVWIGANAITLYLLNNVMSLERIAVRFVGGDFGAWLDDVLADGSGRLLAHGLSLGLAIAIAGFLYKRKIFLRV